MPLLCPLCLQSPVALPRVLLGNAFQSEYLNQFEEQGVLGRGRCVCVNQLYVRLFALFGGALVAHACLLPWPLQLWHSAAVRETH